MAVKGWSTPFDDPIPLSRGHQLVTLRHAGGYITSLPKAEQLLDLTQPPREFSGRFADEMQSSCGA